MELFPRLATFRRQTASAPQSAPHLHANIFATPESLSSIGATAWSSYLALNKGGVFKLFRDGKLVCSDTQLSVQAEDNGQVRNAVAHLVGSYDVQFGQDNIGVSGDFGWGKSKLMTTFNLVVLRFLMLSVGRFDPDLVRKLLQKLLITGKKPAPLRFSRSFAWEGGHLKVVDQLHAASWTKVLAVGLGASQTSIYVVMSRTYQAGQLQPWLDLTGKVRRLREGESLELERTL